MKKQPKFKRGDNVKYGITTFIVEYIMENGYGVRSLATGMMHFISFAQEDVLEVIE